MKGEGEATLLDARSMDQNLARSPVGKEQFLRSGWRKRERHRSLDGELLPFSLAKARLTVVKQNAVMAS